MTAPESIVDAHDAAVQAARNHQTMAKVLIKKGLDLLKPENISAEDYAKASAALDRGIRIESHANEELLKLLRNTPRR